MKTKYVIGAGVLAAGIAAYAFWPQNNGKKEGIEYPMGKRITITRMGHWEPSNIYTPTERIGFRGNYETGRSNPAEVVLQDQPKGTDEQYRAWIANMPKKQKPVGVLKQCGGNMALTIGGGLSPSCYVEKDGTIIVRNGNMFETYGFSEETVDDIRKGTPK